MNTPEEVRRLAHQHRQKLRLYFWPPLAISFGLGWLGAWAQHQSGWEAEVLWFILVSVSTVLLMFAIFSGILLFRWHKLVTKALVDAAKYKENPAWFKSVYKEVIGPFPW